MRIQRADMKGERHMIERDIRLREKISLNYVFHSLENCSALESTFCWPFT